jgi:2-hydroxychromene-2-carboxylate isomerase
MLCTESGEYPPNLHQKYMPSPSVLSTSIAETKRLATDKDKWIEMERRRWTRLFSIPMGESLPKGFPPLTLSIMRTLCALTILDSDQEKLCRALDALYKAFWVDLKPTNEPEVMAQVLTQTLGEEETRNSKWEPASLSHCFRNALY